MINIEADFDLNELDSIIDGEMDNWFDGLAKQLFETGKKAIDYQIAKIRANKSFDGGGFGNITYNLRSSMGVGLVIDGHIKEDYFPFGKGDVGQQHGRDLLKTVAGEIDENICLVMVAGELYGVFVQRKGYDVIKMAEGTLGAEFLNDLNNG